MIREEVEGRLQECGSIAGVNVRHGAGVIVITVIGQRTEATMIEIDPVRMGQSPLVDGKCYRRSSCLSEKIQTR